MLWIGIFNTFFLDPQNIVYPFPFHFERFSSKTFKQSLNKSFQKQQKKGGFIHKTKSPYQHFHTVSYIQLPYSIGAFPLPLSDKKILCAIATNT